MKAGIEWPCISGIFGWEYNFKFESIETITFTATIK
jgi:hypothetical protein